MQGTANKVIQILQSAAEGSQASRSMCDYIRLPYIFPYVAGLGDCNFDPLRLQVRPLNENNIAERRERSVQTGAHPKGRTHHTSDDHGQYG